MLRKIKNIIMICLTLLLVCTNYFTISFIRNNNIDNNMIMQNGFEGIKENSNNMESMPEKPDSQKDISSSKSNEQHMPENINPKDNNMQNMSSLSTNISLIYYILFIVQSFLISLLLIYLIMSKFNKKTLRQTLSSKDKVVIYFLSIIILTGVLTSIDLYIFRKLDVNLLNDKNMNMNENNEDISYQGVYEITENKEITSGEYSSNSIDENAILISGNIDVKLENITVEKNGDSSGGDKTSFYGINSAILAKSKANLTLKNLNIITNAVGANGVFSYGGLATTKNTSSDGTTVTISDSIITTKKDNSGGIMTTGGGTTNAYNLKVNTSGVSSAAIRTDRGGGNVFVDGGTYETTGAGSPSIYSTAKINVKNATLSSKVSEGIIIEGKNSVEIDNCNLIDSNTKLNGLSTTYKNIFLYQSMSGDADTGNASFTASNSKITTNNGDTFYITNTKATITLNNNEFINNDNEGNFLRAKKDSWGNNGSNGASVKLIMNNQKALGNIVIDSISTLDMSISDSSYYEGIINGDNTAKEITLKLDKTSKIKLTGNSYITSLDNDLSDNSNIDFNGYKLYVNEVVIN